MSSRASPTARSRAGSCDTWGSRTSLRSPLRRALRRCSTSEPEASGHAGELPESAHGAAGGGDVACLGRGPRPVTDPHHRESRPADRARLPTRTPPSPIRTPARAAGGVTARRRSQRRPRKGSSFRLSPIGCFSVVVGGFNNAASGSQASILGGAGNAAALGSSPCVTGGQGNTATGSFSVVGGGQGRTAPGPYDWVAGSLSQDD